MNVKNKFGRQVGEYISKFLEKLEYVLFFKLLVNSCNYRKNKI